MLPTRKVFLETGLAPVPMDDCPICSEPLKDPVCLPCHEKHIFCKECITEWLTVEGVNTCPSCRKKLFDKARGEYYQYQNLDDYGQGFDGEDYAGEEDRLEDQAPYLPADPNERDFVVDRARFLAGMGAEPHERHHYRGFLRRRSNAPSHTDRSGHAGKFLCAFEGFNDAGEQMIYDTLQGGAQALRGQAWIRARTLVAHLTAMERLISNGLAVQLGCPYSDQERQEWRSIVDMLGNILTRRNGSTFKVKYLLAYLGDTLWAALPLLHASVFFSTQAGKETRRDNVKFLGCFVVREAWFEQQKCLLGTKRIVWRGKGR